MLFFFLNTECILESVFCESNYFNYISNWLRMRFEKETKMAMHACAMHIYALLGHMRIYNGTIRNMLIHVAACRFKCSIYISTIICIICIITVIVNRVFFVLKKVYCERQTSENEWRSAIHPDKIKWMEIVEMVWSIYW